MIDEFDEEFDDMHFDESYADETEWDVDYEQEAESQYPVKTKKNRLVSKLISFLIVVIFLGGGIYFAYLKIWPQISTSLNNDQMNTTANTSNGNDVAPEIAAIKNDNVGALDNVPTSDSNNIDDMSFDNQESLPPMPTPVSTNIDINTGEDATPPNVESLTPLPELTDISMETLPSLNDDAMTQNEDVIKATSAPVANTDIAFQNIEQSQDKDPVDQNAILKSEHIVQLESMLAETKAELDDAKKTIEALEKELKTTKTALNKAKSKVAKPISKPKKTTTSTPQKPRKKAVVKPVSKKEKTQSVQWVLRAAKPGQATVAMKGTNELKSITVGNTLSGIGKITSISNSSGKWVIQGTKGSVSQ